MFDFAEKVLLPRLLEQPGQLHFLTGLKFDINGVASSRNKKTHVFGLPEGHWPKDKTANSVCSMIYHCLILPSEREGRGGTLYLTADNCAGQNKNRFMLSFCCWLVLSGRERTVVMNFRVFGHTKNVCDGSSGHVKQLLRRTNVRTPAEMMGVIRESSNTTDCILSVDVISRDWKAMLSEYCKISPKFGIRKYHEFAFGLGYKGFVKARLLSTLSDVDTFCLLKPKMFVKALIKDWYASLGDENLRLPTPDFTKVPSKQQKT